LRKEQLRKTGTIRIVLVGVLALLLSGCVFQPIKLPTPPPLLHSGTDILIPDVDVLEVSPAMQRFLDRYVMKYKNRQSRLYLLTLAVNNSAVLNFDYDMERTLTAAEAFDLRAGNCIAFANMYIALARRAGLDAWFQEVSMRPEWSSHNDTLLVAKHINIVVEGPHRGYVIDVTGTKIRLDARRRVIPDHEGNALYFNNLGAEALLENDLATAYAYLVKAIETAPKMPDAWINLGVVYNRNGQFEDAELAYKTALQNDSMENAAMANLYDLYVEQGDLVAASELESKVERYRRHNPYYLLLLSEEAVEQGYYDESFRLLSRAIEEKENEHLFHFAMARTQFLSGETQAAQESMNRARELAPREERENYNRPMHELVELFRTEAPQ
jgi:tetratricopeptide (TPR) repeat protein